MPVKINASSSSGLVVDSDLTGSLKLQTAGNDALTVDSSQVVNFTKQFQFGGVLPPAFNARAATTQSISNATYTKITLGTEEFDTNSNFASSRFTPTVAGYYLITGSVTIQSAAAAVITLIYKNGSEAAAGTALPATGQFSATATTSAVLYCNGSSDYIELYAYQGSGGSVTIGSGFSTQMTGCLVRAA
jgi:hypothetical protein